MLILREDKYTNAITIYSGPCIAVGVLLTKIKDIIDIIPPHGKIYNPIYYRPLSTKEIDQYFTDEEKLELL